jgi:hypothetical protein
MNTVTPQDLIAALKSGKFRKARNMLAKRRNGDRFCCLGVACVLAEQPFRDSAALIPGTNHWGSGPEWAPWLDYRLQNELTRANDKTGGWDRAIKMLESVEV